MSELNCGEPGRSLETWKMAGVEKPPTHLVSEVLWVKKSVFIVNRKICFSVNAILNLHVTSWGLPKDKDYILFTTFSSVLTQNRSVMCLFNEWESLCWASHRHILLKVWYIYLSGEVPWSQRWFSQDEAHPLLSRCADCYHFPKCVVVGIGKKKIWCITKMKKVRQTLFRMTSIKSG